MSRTNLLRRFIFVQPGLLVTFARAFLIVSLTAANVRLISAGRWLPMFLTGAALSWVWWGNSRCANRESGRLPQLAYAAGAGLGTLTGAWLAGWL
jgi:hypothetical protein